MSIVITVVIASLMPSNSLYIFFCSSLSFVNCATHMRIRVNIRDWKKIRSIVLIFADMFVFLLMSAKSICLLHKHSWNQHCCSASSMYAHTHAHILVPFSIPHKDVKTFVPFVFIRRKSYRCRLLLLWHVHWLSLLFASICLLLYFPYSKHLSVGRRKKTRREQLSWVFVRCAFHSSMCSCMWGRLMTINDRYMATIAMPM